MYETVCWLPGLPEVHQHSDYTTVPSDSAIYMCSFSCCVLQSAAGVILCKCEQLLVCDPITALLVQPREHLIVTSGAQRCHQAHF